MQARGQGASFGRARRIWRGRGRSRRGVSEVIATILILALTVALFATIFAFVTSFPAPPAESVNQFESSLSYAVSKSGSVYCGSTVLKSGTAGQICGLSILQTAGPVVYSDTIVYLSSQNTVTNWQFKTTNGILVGWGINNASTGWVTGMSWTTIFSPTLAVPDNITVAIVSTTTLLYRIQVTGGSPSLPPVLTQTYISPSNPAIKAGFQIFAVVTGSLSGLTVNVSLAEIPGLSGVSTMTYNSTAGAYWLHVASGKTTTNGTYYAFVRGSSSYTGSTISGTVLVKIGSSGGGGSSGGTFTVAVGLSTQPPPGETTTAYFWAQVSDTSKVSGTVTVTFWINQTTPQGLKHVVSLDFYTSAATALSGPGSVTIYTSSVYPSSTTAWLFNSTVAVQAVAVGGGGISGTAVGTTTFTMPAVVTGEVCASTTATSCATGKETSFTHYTGTGGCTTSTCPYLVAYVTNNWGVEISVSGRVWANSTAGTKYGGTAGYPLTGTTFTVNNAASAGESAVTGLTATPRWTVTVAGTYTMTAWLTVTSYTTGVVLGYIYVTGGVTVH